MPMSLRRLALATAFAAVAIAGLFASTANASRSLSLSPAGNITAASLGLLSFSATIIGVPILSTCAMTLTGSLGRSIPKRSGTDLGAIHNGNVGCNPLFGQPMTADVSSLIGTGWRLQYQTFAGRLPYPSAVHATIKSIKFLWTLTATGSSCLFEGDYPLVIGFSGAPPNTSGLVRTARHLLSLSRTLSGSCPIGKYMDGSFSLTPRQTLVLLN